ncbi:hypothetical protein N7447_008232 [Penicillium robsamsonii]|uniref:uncharacterized protein n=1 Tax=Penicillium robsamsonii TaxID=1792511 RepID=UPI0025485C86|nr:uncharacterized protein N7447_008232 [Penicillium robsamsonii]KAJ5815999.1 hypothetical protein N7447_008232 [Penicillium robsamsonii]
MSNQIKNTEERIQEALNTVRELIKPNIAKLAREFNSNSDRAKSTRTLNQIQERVLITWVKNLDNSYTSPTPDLIEKAANRLLKMAGLNQTVGGN